MKNPFSLVLELRKLKTALLDPAMVAPLVLAEFIMTQWPYSANLSDAGFPTGQLAFKFIKNAMLNFNTISKLFNLWLIYTIFTIPQVLKIPSYLHH